MTKFDREAFATTGFLKEGGEEPVLFGYTEVVILGPTEVVTVLLDLTEIDMIIKNTRYNVSRVFAESSKR